MAENSLKNKKILITGINGFIGSHLAKRLRILDADVYGISKSIKTQNILKANIDKFWHLKIECGSITEVHISKKLGMVCGVNEF